MNWQAEAERLRNVAGQLQDDNDRLRHELLCSEEKSEASYQRILELFAQIDALRAIDKTDVERLRKALCELHRAITEDDMSDCDHARLLDAVAEAQNLAPYIPQPVSEDGF